MLVSIVTKLWWGKRTSECYETERSFEASNYLSQPYYPLRALVTVLESIQPTATVLPSHAYMYAIPKNQILKSSPLDKQGTKADPAEQ